MGRCIVAVEDLGDLLEGWAVGFDVEEVDEDEFAEVPELGRESVRFVRVNLGRVKGGRRTV